MPNPRIAYITNSTEGGGAALPIPALTRVLRDLGAEVRVFALERRDGRALPSLVEAGLDPLVRPGGGKHDNLAALRWLDAAIRDWGATHLWTSLTRSAALGLLLARRRHLPTCCWLMNTLPKAGNRWVLRALQSRAHTWITVSGITAQLAREKLGVESARLMTWPMFMADTSAPLASPWEPGEPLQLGSVGRLHPVKGYDVLIDALAQLRRAGFHAPVPFSIAIAGEGAERAALEARARAAGVTELRLLGYTEQPQKFLAGLHLYLQPSRSEGFGNGAHEAMTAAVPVLASATGGMPQSIVNGVTGLTVPPGDPAALAAGLQRLLSQPEQLQQMGVAARARVLDLYSQQRFIAAGTELFNRMVAAGAR